MNSGGEVHKFVTQQWKHVSNLATGSLPQYTFIEEEDLYEWMDQYRLKSLRFLINRNYQDAMRTSVTALLVWKQFKICIMAQLENQEYDSIIVSLLTIIASCLAYKKRIELANIIVHFALKIQHDFQDARDLEEYLNPTKHTYSTIYFFYYHRSKIMESEDDKQKLKQQSSEDDVSLQVNPMLPYINEEELESPMSPKQKVLIYKENSFFESIIQFFKCKDKKK